MAAVADKSNNKFSLLNNEFVSHILKINDSENVSSFLKLYHPNCSEVGNADETLTALLLLLHASFAQSDRLAEFRDAMCKMDSTDQEEIASILESFRDVDLNTISLEDLKTIIVDLDVNVGTPQCVTPRRPIAFLVSPESAYSSPLEMFFQTPRRKPTARGNCKSYNSSAVKILKSQLDDDERERTALEEKLVKCSRSLQECERKLACEIAKITDLQSIVVNLEEDRMARIQECELISDKLEKTSKKLIAVEEDLEFSNLTCAKATSEAEQLRINNDVLTKEVHELQQEFGSLDNNLNTAQRRIAELEQALRCKTADFEDVNQCYQALKKPVDLDLIEPSFEEPETLAGLTDRLLGETRAENNELTTKIDSIVKDRDELETALLACKEDCVRKQRAIAQTESDVVRIQKLLDTERISNRLDIQVLRKNLSDISICLDNVTKERDDNKSDLATSEEAFQALKREITKIEKTLHEERIAAEQKVESLRDEMEKKVAKLNNVVLNYEEERRVADEKYHELKNNLCNANDLFAEVAHTLTLCKDQLDVKMREIFSMNKTLAKLNECVSNSQKVLEDERILSRQQIESLVEKLSNADVMCRKLESDLTIARDQIDLNNHDLFFKMENGARKPPILNLFSCIKRKRSE